MVIGPTLRVATLPTLLALASSAASGVLGTGSTRPGAGFVVTDYRLALAPDVATRTLSGGETITLHATGDGLRRLAFSANALVIDAASLDGVPVAHGVHGDVLAFDLPRPLRRGRRVKLRLTYHGRPARGFAGSGTTLYTSYFACDWMVCPQDEFGEKASFSLDLAVPVAMTSLSVGSLVGRRPGPDGGEVHRWRSPRPYSSYLYGFAIGRFTRIEEASGSHRLAYLSDAVSADDLRRRFADTRDVVAFLSNRAGVPLPIERYTQLLVDGDEAQEAATYSVLGTEAVPTRQGTPSADWAIVHELAHQWWGNLVTCKTLGDFWLNEGITTFMTAAWKERRYGRAAYDGELDVARGRVERARAAGFDKPLAWAGAYPSLGLRRAIQYSKGALFMAYLRATLGEEAFWTGFRRYTRDHAGGTATSVDLERAMEASSGRDLRTTFADWVFGNEPPADRVVRYRLKAMFRPLLRLRPRSA